MRALLRFLYKLKLLYCKIFKPTTVGVRILLVEGGKIVLIKHTYQDHWYLPGGGVRKRETIEEAIKREIREELGGEIRSLELFGVYSNFFEGSNDHIVVFLTDDFSIGKASSNEIEKVKTFPINDLPNNTSPGSRNRINEFLKKSRRVFLGEW